MNWPDVNGTTIITTIDFVFISDGAFNNVEARFDIYMPSSSNKFKSVSTLIASRCSLKGDSIPPAPM